ncbi:NtaA/DmoA family FMN-dependent monooxygenase [Arthrobacter sp. D1-29]
MSDGRRLHLNIVGNELNLHQGARAFERDNGGGPDRTSAFGPILEMGKLADEGLFTAMFLGDIAGSIGSPAIDDGAPEPLTAMAALSRETKNLGFIATASTSFYDPYNIARLVGSLDLISEGRAGMNAITSAADFWALNYSQTQHLDREARYKRADEFLDVIKALWDNRDFRTDPDGIRRFYSEPINHTGENFQVTGPLNVHPSRQGRPLIAQAGGSGPGINVAAKHADMVFTNAYSRESAKTYRASLDEALAKHGRAAGSAPAIPGLIPYIAKTAREAEERMHALDDYIDWESIAPYALMEFGIQYTYNSVNDPFPVEVLPNPEDVKDTLKSVFGNYVGLWNHVQANPGLTVRDLVAHAMVRGGAQHRKFVGSYDDFADELVDWFEDGNIGGFNLMFPTGSMWLQEFVDEAVPRLIDRGIYRSTPDTRVLRERFQA